MNRRSLLKAIAAGSMTAMTPMASLLARSAMAADGPSQIKTLFIFQPCGSVPDYFFPKAGQTNLPQMSAPLQSVFKHLVFIDGIGMAGRANTHEGGAAKCLTGFGGDSNDNASAGNSSIEVQMGKEDWANRATTKISIPSIQMGVGTMWGAARHLRISFDGSQDLHSVDDPRILYPQLFGAGGNTGGGAANDIQLQILSRSLADLNRLKTSLGSVERERLTQYGDSISVLENKLRASSSNLGCGGPNISSVGSGGPDVALWRTAVLANISDIQQDMAVQALSCNLTRSIVFSYGVPGSPIVVPGTTSSEHDLSHQDYVAHTTSKIWWMGQIAKLIQKMANTPDINGSLLDNTIICTVSELGDGNAHSHFRIPMILAGGKNAGLVTGRALDFRPYGTRRYNAGYQDVSVNHADVLATIADKAGYKNVRLPTTEARINNAWSGGVSPT
jgi:hypothetical protein